VIDRYCFGPVPALLSSCYMWILFQYNLLLQDNDLSEFDESRDIIESLVDEYKACESPDYIKWGMEVDSY
jgi:hypothetical protein